MAILKFVNGENKTYHRMREALKYITHPAKTAKNLVYGEGCDPENAFNEFVLTKRLYDNEAGRQFIHFMQSFVPGEGTPEMINAIGCKLLEHDAFKDFQIVMATHIDREHLHNHFIINTVNSDSGKKWKQSRQQLAELKDFSDDICKDHGLSVIEEGIKGYKNNGEYRAAKQERSWKHELCLAVNECRYLSQSKEEFLNNMEKLGYEVSWDYEGESDEMKRLGAIISTCSNYADDEKSFMENMAHYGYTTQWDYKVKVTYIANKEEPKGIQKKLFEPKTEKDQKPLYFDKTFKSTYELERYIQKIDEKLFEVEWTDEISFITSGGEIIHPESFEKGTRFSGTVLREAFELNSQNETKGQLPNVEDIKIPNNNSQMKELFLIVKVCKQHSTSREDFIENMKSLGYSTKWEDNRKYITFETPDGQRIRNRMLFPAKQYTKEALMDTFSFNNQMKSIIDESLGQRGSELIKLATKKRCKLTLDEKKNRYLFEMPGEKKCYFSLEIIEQLKKGKGVIKLPSREDILLPLTASTIMFTNPMGKKCSNKQLFPAEKYTKDALLEAFENNKERTDAWQLHNRMELLLSAVKSLSQEDDNPNTKPFPLSALEGRSIRERLLEEAKGHGIDWDKGNAW